MATLYPHISLRCKAWLALCLAAMLMLGAVDAFAAKGKKKSFSNPQPAVAAKADAKPKRQIKRLTPQIPSANRMDRGKVFLENSDELIMDEARSTEYQVLRGNVKFSRAGMIMTCDSAYFYPESSSLDAFGRVHMTQGDTLQVDADVLHYYGDQETAELRYNVKMRNRSMTLTTDSLDYEVRANVGYYFNGGTLIDSRNNRLTSEYGKYELDTKRAEFMTDVRLRNSKFEMSTNHLLYNTATHIATIDEYTDIVGRDGDRIQTSSGIYNTSRDDGWLFNRSTVYAKDGKWLTGDTLYYDRKEGKGYASGRMMLQDPEHKVKLDGDYGEHNEVTHYSMATGRARVREYSQGDTLFMHGDTLRTWLDGDSLRVMRATRNVKFFRSDLQGLCDSATFFQADSILNLYDRAILWNEDKQISGKEINVHFNDSTPDWATMPQGGILARSVGGDYYDQLSGKKMKAFFVNKELRRLEVDGNVMTIFYPQESDSTYNKQVSAESSFLTIDLLEKQEIDKLKMWPEVTGKVTPLFLLRRAGLYLPGFSWLEQLRPKSPADIYYTDPSLLQLLDAATSPVGRRRNN
ncbi:MAG: hypothetical protein IJ835_04415 [Muribaculaceae bacterium]|nr:hypothetical protein [Muribaculaceae bacterium]